MLVVLGRKQIAFSIQCQSASLGPGLRPILAIYASIIAVYAPTNPTSANEETVSDEFYKQLQSTLAVVPTRDMVIIMEDFNARVGSDNEMWRSVIGIVIVQNNIMRMVNGCLTSVPTMTLLSLTLVSLTRPSTSVHGSATVTALGLEG